LSSIALSTLGAAIKGATSFSSQENSVNFKFGFVGDQKNIIFLLSHRTTSPMYHTVEAT
jgi:hypothetical protein